MTIFLVAFTALWTTGNADFIQTADKQIKEGYVWGKLDCVEPDKSLPRLSFKTPSGKEYTCFQLFKKQLQEHVVHAMVPRFQL